MSRVARMLVLGFVLGGCRHASEAGPADAVLEHYREVLEDTLEKQKDSSDTRQWTETAGQVARAELEPHRGLLHQQAIYLLKQLPRRAVPTTASLRSLQTDEMREMYKTFIEFSLKASPQDENALLMMFGWNPVRAAFVVANLAEGRALSAAEMGRRGVIRAFAPLTMYRASDDWDRPRLILEGGRELFVVELKYDEQRMAYLPQQFDWFAKKALNAP